MEGLRWERTVLLSTPSMRTDFFRPMRRAVTDLNLARKRKNKFDPSPRSGRASNVVPVVSVQYDVPKTPPSPMMYRYRRHHTPCTGSQGTLQGQKNKGDEKNSKFSIYGIKTTFHSKNSVQTTSHQHRCKVVRFRLCTIVDGSATQI